MGLLVTALREEIHFKPKLKPETVPHLNLVKQETIIEKSAKEIIQPQITRSGRIVKPKVKTSPKIIGMCPFITLILM